jgi:hypothetical protein
MTEEEMQAALSAGDLPGTPSEVRAIETAYRAGFVAAIGLAAEKAASHAQVNDMRWPQTIADDIIGLLRGAPAKSPEEQ